MNDPENSTLFEFHEFNGQKDLWNSKRIGKVLCAKKRKPEKSSLGGGVNSFQVILQGK